MIDLLGGDLHRLDSVNKFLEQSPRKKDFLDSLKALTSSPIIRS